MRTIVKILLASTALVGPLGVPSAAAAAAADTRQPLSAAVRFTGATGSAKHGAASGAASFGIRRVHDKHGDVRVFAVYFEVSRTACDTGGCTVKSDVIYSGEADRRVAGRIKVSADLQSATLAPTRLPVEHTRVRIRNDGNVHLSTSISYELVSGSATATKTRAFEKTVEPYADAFLVIRGARATATMTMTVGPDVWTSTRGDGSSISSTTSRLWSAAPS